MLRRVLVCAVMLGTAACSPEPAPSSAPAVPVVDAAAAVPVPEPSAGLAAAWIFDPAAIFPADQSLARPEDGVLLADGRLLVSDEVHGLRLLSDDGSSRPFGGFADAGYTHQPPDREGAANGVALTPDGRHVLVADVLGGGIYRVDVDSEATERVYQHPHGVNTAVADSVGGIWFTQSTTNRQADGHVGIFSAIDQPQPNGALYYLTPAAADGARTAQLRVDGLQFGNGVVLDEANSALYVAETLGHRVLRFPVAADGTLGERSVLAELTGPDNIELGSDGRLWVAQPIDNKLSVVDTASGAVSVAFQISTPESLASLQQIGARIAKSEGWLSLLTPTLWLPAPGLMTGVILAPDGSPRYWTGLGKAIVRLDPVAAQEP